MTQQQTTQQQTQHPHVRVLQGAVTAEASPSDIARRELVDWCESHGLPVPTDRRAPRR